MPMVISATGSVITSGSHLGSGARAMRQPGWETLGEPQSDCQLRIPEALGGQSHIDAESYITGPPSWS